MTKNIKKALLIILGLIFIFLLPSIYFLIGAYTKGADFVYDRDQALDVGKNPYGIRDIDYEMIKNAKELSDEEKNILINYAKIDQDIIRYSNNKLKVKDLDNSLNEISSCILYYSEKNIFFDSYSDKVGKYLGKPFQKERELFFKEFMSNISTLSYKVLNEEEIKQKCPKYTDLN